LKDATVGAAVWTEIGAGGGSGVISGGTPDSNFGGTTVISGGGPE
jgi:hypothetical protein